MVAGVLEAQDEIAPTALKLEGAGRLVPARRGLEAEGADVHGGIESTQAMGAVIIFTNEFDSLSTIGAEHFGFADGFTLAVKTQLGVEGVKRFF